MIFFEHYIKWALKTGQSIEGFPQDVLIDFLINVATKFHDVEWFALLRLSDSYVILIFHTSSGADLFKSIVRKEGRPEAVLEAT